MQSDPKGIETRGDAALIAAITTGAPVPTTAAQAKELTPPAAPSEWKCIGTFTGVGSYVVNNDDNGYGPMTQHDAKSLCARLNRADAMERSLTELLAMCERQDDFNDDRDGGTLQRARAALRK